MDQHETQVDLNPAPTTSATDQVPSTDVIGATATITLPQLADSASWFIHAEYKFRSHRVTSEVRKYELLLEALPLQAMAEIRDILVQPRDETPYTTIK
ncbi:hypothetical protein HPB49_013716 [Dermacentor silvarum]|uniref:Uncharacterized protein n=1 Tax=Dermacentor silvarum TaxID=543639 RepID=A0ACB8CLE9_DERSI|nr:hypothetical protein HPB49_013716 [Dermacentor silvarum]